MPIQNEMLSQAEAHLLALEQSLDLLKTVESALSDGFDASSQQTLTVLDLVLQFRLDTQDALRQLFMLEQSLWQVLGVSPSASETLNLERLAFALGSDDLHYVLSRLNQLMQVLKRQIHRQLMKEKTFQEARSKPLLRKKDALTKAMLDKAILALTHANMHTKSFLFEIKRLTDSFDAMEGTPVVGESYEYLVVLQGPISRFYQAMLNGLVMTSHFYKQLSLKNVVDERLSPIFDQLKAVLIYETHHEPHLRLFSPAKAPLPNLEERAAERRLGQFFYYP